VQGTAAVPRGSARAAARRTRQGRSPSGPSSRPPLLRLGIILDMEDSRPLVDTLGREGYRVTGPRRKVADLIAGRTGHFTAADLTEDARRRGIGIGRATIFRALELFTELGVVERLDLPSGDHAYVGCEAAHHHHVVCSRCGRSEEVPDLGLGAVAQEVARRTAYRVDGHRLELYGLCPACLSGERREYRAAGPPPTGEQAR